MASSSEKCFFCGEDMENLQNGWCLKNSTYAQLCHICSLAFQQGTFCHLFHGDEDGWRNCDDCGKLVHCGCIMALNTFELNDTCGVTCMECVMKKISVASHLGASSALNPKNCIQLGNTACSDILTEKEVLVDSGRAKDELKNPDVAIIEGNLKMPELSKSGFVFLFEKTLTPTDCDIKAGRFLVPKKCAEDFFPQPARSQRISLPIEDTEGRSWLFVLRWWLNKKNRKYVLDGTRKCIETMRWNVGDKIKFYRKLADGKLVMELERTLATTSASNLSVAEEGMRNP